MTIYVRINDVTVNNTTITVAGLDAISTDPNDPLIGGELLLECREGSAGGIGVGGIFDQFVTVGQGGSTPKFTVEFTSLEPGTDYYLVATLINTLNNSVVATKERIATTLGGEPPPTDFVYGDLSTALAITGITQDSATARVTITNKTSKSGDFIIIFAFRDSEGTEIANYQEPETIAANGTIIRDFFGTFAPAKTYEARAFAAGTDFATILSPVATKMFRTQDTNGGGGGEVTDLRPYAIAAASVAAVLLIGGRR